KYDLLLSANNNNPRVHFITDTKENPKEPPMFCMLMRKKLTNGIITGIRQLEFDRIMEITISSRDELLDVTEMKLIIEIMGRHSNISLVENEIIIDSIKRINKFISSYREVLPGRTYVYPPMTKVDFFTLDFEQFKAALAFLKDKSLSKAVMDSFQGISKPLSLEICHRAKIDDAKKVDTLSNSELEAVFQVMSALLDEKEFNIYTNEKETIIYDFSAIDLAYYSGYRKNTYPTLSLLLENYYHMKDMLFRIKEKSGSITQLISNKLERNYNKLNKLLEEQKDAIEADVFKIYGDLILSNLYNIKGNENSVKLFNFYDDTTIEIPMSTRLTPSENAQKYYAKYNKGRRALAFIADQMRITKNEVFYLESLMDSLTKCTAISELNEIKDELVESGYIKKTGKINKKPKIQKITEPMKFKTSEGYPVLVGKNNKQNDELTLKTASKDDLWFHVKDIPGSHVIIRSDGKLPNEQSIHEAAMLAAFYSKARLSSKVPVDYALVRHVKKPRQANPGMVIYTDNKTIYVTPQENEILNLKADR
ncbi:MAG: fibronectin/fibrinogen-binding protein, partial [Eubacteriaceae bacterium]|nr:fibronectin/fibrinogen-binding protein [Eubacteriaceae bacterium]